MRQLIVFLLGSLLLVGCASQATFGDAITDGEPTPIPTPIIPSKPIYTVERGDILYEQKYFGRIAPVVTMGLEFQLDGQVLETFYAVGDTIIAGDVIATLNTSRLEAQLLDAEEDLAIAQSLFDSASNDIQFGKQRQQLLLDLAQLQLDYVIAQASDPPTAEDEFNISARTIERDLAQLGLDELANGVDPDLQFDVTRAQNRVDEIKANIDSADLIAPMDGQLMSLTVSAGNTVSAFDNVGVIADTSDLELTVTLSPDEMSELIEGMPVRIQRSVGPSEVFDGTIIALPTPYGGGNDNMIHIQFDNPSDTDEFDVGDRFSFTVTVDERNDVLWLPTSAIRQFSGRNFVVIQNESVQQRVDVKLGLEGDNRIEILEGLEENQTVIGP